MLESERFFVKVRLTVVVATAFTEFSQKNVHIQRLSQPRYEFS
jgi:hypothetical protein